MNSNSSKQVVLSIVGVAILVVAIVGVSFAFFTYTRTGGKNNLISTGTLVFKFEDGSSTINLTNQFPMSDANGLELSGTNNVCKFTVSGTTNGDAITYNIYGVQGDAPADKTKTVRFTDSQIKANIKATTLPTGYTFTSATPDVSNNSTAKTIEALKTSGRIKFGTGTVTSAAAADSSAEFTLKMWVSDVVTIGAAKSDTYTTEAYGKLYYSLKIVVDATA